MSADKLRTAILADLQRFYTDLLGPPPRGKVTSRRCFNKAAHENGDASASFGFNPTHGGYQCFGCGVKGDVFSAYQSVRGVSFGQALDELSQAYGIVPENLAETHNRRSPSKEGDRLYVTLSKNEADYNHWLHNAPMWKREQLDFMLLRYGLTEATILRWRLKPVSGRVWIPIPAKSIRNAKNVPPALVNIRKHDCFRKYCAWQNPSTEEVVSAKPAHITLEEIALQKTDWEPFYKGKDSKVLSVKGHGAAYLYPFDILLEEYTPEEYIYLVGGELKALFVIQQGAKALTFTVGEGNFNKGLLHYFRGRRTRVLMDKDSAGVRAALRIAQALANEGAIVEYAKWTPHAEAQVPRKGDITDLLRSMEGDISILSDERFFEWAPMERQWVQEELTAELAPSTKEVLLGTGENIEYTPTSFRGLSSPKSLFHHVEVDVVVSNTSTAPYAAIRRAAWTCPIGKSQRTPACSQCKLAQEGFAKTVLFGPEIQVKMCGLTPEEQLKLARAETKIPVKCGLQELDATYAVVVPIQINPSMDEIASASQLSLVDSKEAHLFGTEEVRLEENTSYKLKGLVFPHPRDARVTLACSEWTRTSSPILDWTADTSKDEAVVRSTRGSLPFFVDLMRRHVTKVVGQEDMILAILASQFMPLHFTLGHERQERACSVVMVLGDTTTGKSQVARNMVSYYGGGHMINSDGNTSTAGLVGGMVKQSGGKMVFQWGILPMMHQRHIILDEMHKLSTETIGSITGLISSGQANRTIVGGTKVAPASLRLLYLANPRSPGNGRAAKKLSSMTNPMDAVAGVLGAPEDIGRLDLVLIQKSLNPEAFRSDNLDYGGGEFIYSKEIAQYHLGWAWTRKEHDFHFEDVRYIIEQSLEQSMRYSQAPILLSSNARFKVARLAAAFALMLFSHDEQYRVVVTREHVDLALDYMSRNYDPFLLRADGLVSNELPSQVSDILRKVPNPEYLGFMAAGREFITFDDVVSAFKNEYLATELLSVLTLELGLFFRKADKYYPSSLASDFPGQVLSFIRAEKARRIR